MVRNYKVNYGNESETLAADETLRSDRSAIKNFQGDGFFSAGQILELNEQKQRSLVTTLVKTSFMLVRLVGELLKAGVHDVTFNGDAVLSYTETKFGNDTSTLCRWNCW